MTLSDLAAKDGDVLLPEDVAAYLGCAPQILREQARRDPSMLGFNVIVVGTRTLIPKRPFIQYMGGLPESNVNVRILEKLRRQEANHGS